MYRTVELTRGQTGGFGFTLSGQYPCRLSSVTPDSPAHHAGLAAGDSVLVANGISVVKATHDQVVGLISSCTGQLRLKIAMGANTASSSDDEGKWHDRALHKHVPGLSATQALVHKEMLRRQQRAFHSDDEEYTASSVPTRTMHVRGNSADSTMTESSAVVEKQPRPRRPSPKKRSPTKSAISPSKSKHVDLRSSDELVLMQRQISSFLNPTLTELRKSVKLNKLHTEDVSSAMFKAVVGYLGTIEMPKDGKASTSTAAGSLSAIRSCIRRLRIEKKVHTSVLMLIFGDRMALLNHNGVRMAEYPGHRIAFCGTCMDDRRFFGLVTSSPADEDDADASSSCHVFMTEAVAEPNEAERRAAVFQFEPTWEDGDKCKEFPATSDPILRAILAAFGRHGGAEHQLVADSVEGGLSPAANSTGSTNSDSGIGFREEVKALAALPALKSASSGEDSFNTEQLDAQSSADNIRNMHKYLLSKQQPLARASRSEVDMAIGPAAKYQTSSSMEDVRAAGSEKVQRLLFNSESNVKGHILRPGDQYPSEPGVLKASAAQRRPVSAASTRTQSLASHDEDDERDSELLSAEEKESHLDGWSRGSSLRKHLIRRSFSSSRLEQVGVAAIGAGGGAETADKNDVTILSEDAEACSVDGSLGLLDGLGGHKAAVDVGRVGNWATDFERLLKDPVGLQTFTEFLKKEFSAENIAFWVSCERFRQLCASAASSASDRHSLAVAILDKHLAAGAPEPVNVDSHARQAALDGIATLTPDVFAAAQKQIYNLMKFDSFTRFLKSDLYKEALMAEMSGRPLPFAPKTEDVAEDAGAKNKAVRKEKPDDSNRRRSLLPWNNLINKDRTKSKERIQTITETSEENTRKLHKSKSCDVPSSADTSKLSNSSSLSHGSDCDGCTLARIILPDKATTVVQTRSGETIRAMVSRLMEKRGLHYTSFDVFVTGQDKPVDLSDDCGAIGCTEVRIEPRVLFRLELPSKKSIGVKAKPAKIMRDVLGPILQQYGWHLEAMVVRRDGERDALDLAATVGTIDNCRLVVAPKTEDDDLARLRHGSGEQRSLRTESARSSSIGITPGQSGDFSSMPPPDKIPQKRVHHQRALPQVEKMVAEELYEGIKLAQRGRLNDQRGTEINFEMPEFLKRSRDKENVPFSGLAHRQSEPLPLGPPRSRPDAYTPDPYLRYSSASGHFAATHEDPYWYARGHMPHNDSNFSHDGYIPSAAEAECFFNASAGSGAFNDSRLSLGFSSARSLPHPHEAVYETLSHYKSGSPWKGPWPPGAGLTPNGMAPHGMTANGRMAPPPLPPKPRLSGVRPSSEADLPVARAAFAHQMHMQMSMQQSRHLPPDQNRHGYSVSFV